MPTRNELKAQFPGASEDFLAANAETPKDLNEYFGKPVRGGNQSKAHDELITSAVEWLHDQGFRVNVPLKSMTGKGYRTAIQGNKGYFDLTAIHETLGIIIFAEVKTGEGTLSPDQEKWFMAASRNPAVITTTIRPETFEQFKQRIIKEINLNGLRKGGFYC